MSRLFLLLFLMRDNVGQAQQQCLVTKEHILQSESWLESSVSPGLGGGVFDNDVVGDIISSLSTYFGDHIDWDALDGFSMAKVYDTKNIKMESHKIADDIKTDIEYHSRPPLEEFSFERVFLAPLSVQNEWNSAIARGSAGALIATDQTNIFFNGGNLTVREIEGETAEGLDMLIFLSKLEEDLDDTFYKTIPITLQYQRQKILFSLNMISSQVACLYDALEQRNSTVSGVFIKNVDKKKFVLFVSEFLGTVEKLLTSEKTIWLVQESYKTLKAKVKSYDYNPLFAEMYLMMMKAREVLLKIDVEAEIENLNEIHYSIAQSVWKLKTGQWPEMAKFVDNFFRKTYGSREFWVRLDKIYHAAVDGWKRLYEERQKEFEIAFGNEIIPFFKNLKNTMERVAAGDKNLIYKMMEKFEFDLENQIHQVNSFLSRNFLACWTRLHGLEHYDQLAEEISQCPDVQKLRELVFADWPQEEIFPPSFNKLAAKLHKTVLLVVSALFGSCENWIE